MSEFINSLKALQDWFIKRQRVLPWRESPDIYRVWISEIMLQQTQVKTVIPYFDRFTSRFPNVESLANAAEENVLSYWAGLGYYARARNLRKAAGIIVQSGRFPTTRDGWLKIPGVGDYTAGAVLSIALDQVEPILDANIKRVIARLRRLHTDNSNKKPFWKWSDFLVHRAAECKIRPSLFNQAMMELGALICLPDAPLCAECPLSLICKAKAAGDMLAYPPRQEKKWKDISETVYCIHCKHKVLLTKDIESRWRKGLWDFPQDRPVFIDLNKTNEKELDIHYIVTNHRVKRKIIILSISTLDSLPLEYRWVDLNDLDNIPIPVGSPTRKALIRISGLTVG